MIKPLERKITTCEMRCLRKVVSKTGRDMIPNTKIRENGRNKDHPSSYSTAEDQMVWTSHTTANTPTSSTCIQHKIQKQEDTPERPGLTE